LTRRARGLKVPLGRRSKDQTVGLERGLAFEGLRNQVRVNALYHRRGRVTAVACSKEVRLPSTGARSDRRGEVARLLSSSSPTVAGAGCHFGPASCGGRGRVIEDLVIRTLGFQKPDLERGHSDNRGILAFRVAVAVEIPEFDASWDECGEAKPYRQAET
jgi:hypothetical protein